MTKENEDTKTKTLLSQSELKELLSTFLDDASKAKAELMDKEIRTFLELQGDDISLLKVTAMYFYSNNCLRSTRPLRSSCM